jgi:DNA polymerase III alpha subunit
MLNEKNTIEELIAGILNHGVDVIEHSEVDADLSGYLHRISQEKLQYPIPKKIDTTDWFIPESYKQLDIEGYIREKCPEENLDRVNQELGLFKSNNMIPVLKTIKYIVDVLREKNIVWGVGRGSSVASYTLFLLGIHKIDSVKYKLPIEEFFKGEQNG